MAFTFPDDFELGVASAATQIEGGDTANSWYDWYATGHIPDGSDPSVATRHYELYEEDARLMESMGIRHYRMGLEWARLEPEEGVFNEEVFTHYRDEIQLLQSMGIEILLTLHHFTTPLWFEKLGSFENPKSVEIFLSFVKKVIEELGDLVSQYITINEPNVYVSHGWFLGAWPPGKKSMKAAFRVMTTLCVCHIRAYTLIHDMRRCNGYDDTMVSYAHHMRSFVPLKRYNPIHLIMTPLFHRIFQSSISRSFLTGASSWPIGRMKGIRKGLYCDFHAVNYYSRTAVSGLSDGTLPHVPVNDLGWEIYPEGIVKNTQELFRLANLPIYITENGTCDNEDSFRNRYISEHLKMLCESGLPVKRYYHWCFTDNFEWLEGVSARFGLVAVDYATQKRIIKKSGEFYIRMIAEKGISENLEKEYCKQAYRLDTAHVTAAPDATEKQKKQEKKHE
ncbi:glycoside hydrolase family 1 protein [Parasphaerochaeta coccoides]|uniref:Beta-glucosidase n=1 Tax=Parasphaerochaeta coccoides (strain ATCC BAA-1237 / DSM 17374 / SPN1) TaxID=760011 RepID=F4GH96_PARC1|nr:family 1 glycosylhydrolase [Parasphaerochaeta coccoides]AEC01995.1 Beta-glucosidase [Parasphaerochaeta coccoides DSM 17374]